MNKNPEQSISPESREQPSSRQIEILMVRHGKQDTYEDPKSELSKEGEEQAENFVQFIIDTYKDEKVIIKIKKSPEQRATRTADIITKTLERRINEEGLKNITLLKTKPSKNLKTTGALGPIIESGIPYEKAVDEWLNSNDKYPQSKKPEEVNEQLNEILTSAQKLSERLQPEEQKIVYIWITHETAHSALLNNITGKNTEELGGSIGHLEPLKISIDGNNPPIAEFRDQEHTINLEKNEKVDT